ncbi:hypothetical protein CO045_01430 [Candidatus Peregrinibacteria bacterium CG_4_9_14_0_2_um_filter_41_14]|nr:MAG: hypothetical protein CO045_01430 [Candidatus Peregrinibacteria bacterium CG_4_9_14_0_2_um_filter_41_14]
MEQLARYQNELKRLIQDNGGDLPIDFDYCTFFLKRDYLQVGVSLEEYTEASLMLRSYREKMLADNVDVSQRDFLETVTTWPVKRGKVDGTRSTLTDLLLFEGGTNCESHAVKAGCFVANRYPGNKIYFQKFRVNVDGEEVGHVRAMVELNSGEWVFMDPNDGGLLPVAGEDLTCSRVTPLASEVYRFLGDSKKVGEVEVEHPCTEGERRLREEIKAGSLERTDGSTLFGIDGVKDLPWSGEAADGRLRTDAGVVMVVVDGIEMTIADVRIEDLKMPLSLAEIVRRRSSIVLDGDIANDSEARDALLERVRANDDSVHVYVDNPETVDAIRALLVQIGYDRIYSWYFDLTKVDTKDDFVQMISVGVNTIEQYNVTLNYNSDQAGWVDGYPWNLHALKLHVSGAEVRGLSVSFVRIFDASSVNLGPIANDYLSASGNVQLMNVKEVGDCGLGGGGKW